GTVDYARADYATAADATVGGADATVGGGATVSAGAYATASGGPAVAGGLVLALSYGAWRWTYPLVAADVWIPLGRGLVANGRLATIRLPDFLVAVPRGALLVLRARPGGPELRRSPERAEYTVTVDGHRLRPNSTVPV